MAAQRPSDHSDGGPGRLRVAARGAEFMLRLQNRILTELTDELDMPSLRAAIEQLLGDLLEQAVVGILPTDSSGRITCPLPEGGQRVVSAPELELLRPALQTPEPAALGLPRGGWALLPSLLPDARPEPCILWGVRLGGGERPSGLLVLQLAGAAGDVDPATGNVPLQELLSALAPAVSIALENARRFEREHLRASRLVAAHSLARTVACCTGRDELADAVALGVRAVFGFTRAAIYDAELHRLADDGAASPRASERERSLVSTTLHRRRASRVERYDRTSHAVPISAGGRILCTLYVERPDTITPEQETDDLRLLSSVCDHAAACIVALEAIGQLERSYKDTIQALVHALEARDQYTADHSDVVAQWALETGRRLGMDDAALRDLELGAMLHDIGKVAVPDGILNKPGRLTAEEFEVMKSHTVVGERILKPIGFLANVAPIVRHEHERWDGAGYPDGLSGDEIPLASRIIFVCDAYHAITSDRPYRTAQSHAFARRVLEENAGTQFDPAVVSVFLEVADSWCLHQGILDSDLAQGIEVVNDRGISLARPDEGEDAAAA